MKLRHTAAFALIGWYLMLPPLTKIGIDSYDLPPNTAAPLSEWTYAAVDHFDTEEDCQSELRNRQTVAERSSIRDPLRRFHKTTNETLAMYYEARQQAARCVPDNDPSIKPK